MQTVEIDDGGEEQGKSKDEIIPQKSSKSSAEAISNQSDLMEEILSRLPVKTLLQFRCVSKPWRSLISNQSFVKLHRNRTNHHGLIIHAFDLSNFENYFLFANNNGGSITRILTIPDFKSQFIYHTQHVNGLLLFCPEFGSDENYFAFVYNPSTSKIFKVPRGYDMPKVTVCNCYSLVFDESSSEHKILNFKTIGVFKSFGDFKSTGLEIEIFSLSTYTWRKIDVDFPLDPSLLRWFRLGIRRVFINSAIYFVLRETKSILVFDLRTETFSCMNSPPGNFRHGRLFIIAINGSLGAFGQPRIEDHNNMEFWILEDCKNQVWVKDTITLPNCWVSNYSIPHPVDFRGGEIVFSSTEVSANVLNIPMYDMKNGTFRSVEVNLGRDFLCSKTLHVNGDGVWSYVESMMPLRNSAELVPLISVKESGRRSNTNA